MPAFKEEYQKELDDMRRQSIIDWRERVLRVEEPVVRIKEDQRRIKESVTNFIQMAHENPEWHLKFMAKELEWETFCLINKIKYEPGWKDGVPGYWEFRKQHAEEWILNTRERLPNE